MAIQLAALAIILISSPVIADNSQCSRVLEKLNIAILETGTYLIPTQELQWESALQYCKKFGSNLVQLNGVDESNAILNAASTLSEKPAHFWTLGTNRGRLDKKFVWAVQVPGSPIQDDLMWLPGEPSHVQKKSSGECISVSLRNGGIADNYCSEKLRPICEFPTDVDTCDKIFGLLRIKTLATGTYLFTEKFYDWYNASQLCDGLGMELAVTENIDEINIVYQEAIKLFPDNERFWIGGLDKGIKGSYVWTNGKPVDTTLWIKKHPAHVTEQEPACITLRKNGLGDCPCSVGRRSICKLK